MKLLIVQLRPFSCHIIFKITIKNLTLGHVYTNIMRTFSGNYYTVESVRSKMQSFASFNRCRPDRTLHMKWTQFVPKLEPLVIWHK
jgi:hypothetical protein